MLQWSEKSSERARHGANDYRIEPILLVTDEVAIETYEKKEEKRTRPGSRVSLSRRRDDEGPLQNTNSPGRVTTAIAVMSTSSPSTTTSSLSPPNAYKKARRQYLKATKTRDSHLELDWTPFRAAEKYYKARFPPPDLSNVLDLATSDVNRAEEIGSGAWRGRADAVESTEITTTGRSRAYTIPRIPGATVSLAKSPIIFILVTRRPRYNPILCLSGRAEKPRPMVPFWPSTISK